MHHAQQLVKTAVWLSNLDWKTVVVVGIILLLNCTVTMCWSKPDPPVNQVVMPATRSSMGNDTSDNRPTTQGTQVTCPIGAQSCSDGNSMTCINGICCILSGDQFCKCYDGFTGTSCHKRIALAHHGADTTIGIVIGLVLVVIVIVVLAIYLHRKKGWPASCRNQENEERSQNRVAFNKCLMCTRDVSDESTTENQVCLEGVSKTSEHKGSENPKEDRTVQSTHKMSA